MSNHEKPPETEHRRTHVLLTVLGASPRAARYGLEEREVEAQLAPAALFELLPPEQRPDRLLAICTARAKKESWPLLQEVLRDRCELQVIDVPDGEAQEDVGEYLARVAKAVPPDVDLTVDVTHGYRHFSFLTYVAVLYLAALRGVQVRGAYYGLLRSTSPPALSKPNSSATRHVEPHPVSPFLDLRPLLELPRWLHALETLRETGSTGPLADALRAGPQSQSTRKVSNELSRLSEAYLSGLPLELGHEAGKFHSRSIKPFAKLLRDNHRLPLAAELAQRIGDIIEPFALCSTPGKVWKRDVALSTNELKRQVRVIDDLLQHGNTASALGLMNEWTVSWTVWRLDPQPNWLDYQNVRRRAGNLLNAVAAVVDKPDLRDLLTDDQRELGDFWRKLCELRNAYAHHGMRPQVVVGDPKIAAQLKSIRSFWETLRACPDFSLSLGASQGRRVLVSPVGQRPGVLFSAMQTRLRSGDTKLPITCLAICSRETEEFIAEAVSRAGHAGTIQPLRLNDPYSGTAEIRDLEKAAQHHLIGAEDVLVNVTGGTTLMGIAAEALATTARELARPVRRFGLIDRRTSEQQMANPYRAGEPFWLDLPINGDDDDD